MRHARCRAMGETVLIASRSLPVGAFA